MDNNANFNKGVTLDSALCTIFKDDTAGCFSVCFGVCTLEVTVYYAVKGDLIAFSPTSVEEAKSNAETEYDKIFSFVFFDD